MTEVLQAAHTITEYGVFHYADFADADLEELLAEASTWVFRQIPIKADASPEELKKLEDIRAGGVVTPPT